MIAFLVFISSIPKKIPMHLSRPSHKSFPAAYTAKKLNFTDLPLEVRVQVYDYLLMGTTPIKYPGGLVQSKFRLGVDPPDHPDLDAAIIRTCRQVYEEALPILYVKNRFVFDNPECIEAFHFGRLATVRTEKTTRPIFGLQAQPHGRLTLIKQLTIRFWTADEQYLFGDTRRNGNRILNEWQSFFHEEPSDLVYSFDGKGFARFPALEKLYLDFSGLELEGEGLTTAPIVRKFFTAKGLRELQVAGIKHEGTLQRLKAGLVRDGGEFLVIASTTTQALTLPTQQISQRRTKGQ
ncbi:MAG: hypothetical protein Q9170_003782 [Blastenia crenularia]